VRILVLHKGYGCDTGCCGHAVEVDGVEAKFKFTHPYKGEDFRAFAERIVREAGCDPGDLDFEGSVVVMDTYGCW